MIFSVLLLALPVGVSGLGAVEFAIVGAVVLVYCGYRGVAKMLFSQPCSQRGGVWTA